MPDTLTITYRSAADLADVAFGMDNTGWYWSGTDAHGLAYFDVGPFSSRQNAADDAADCGVTT